MPWVIALLPRHTVEFKVQLIDVNTLSLKGEHYDWIEGHSFSVLLIDTKGQIIGQVGSYRIVKETKHRLMWRWPFLKPIQIETKEAFGETVEEALRRIGPRAADVRYIFQSGSIAKNTTQQVVTIHKVPKRIPNLKVWLDKKAEEEKCILRQTLEA